MKPLAAAVFVLAGMAAAEAAPPPAPPPAPGLRQTLLDLPRQARDAPPRQLSADERAELRRQLIQYGRPARAPVHPEPR
jgi:hypothetical protein